MAANIPYLTHAKATKEPTKYKKIEPNFSLLRRTNDKIYLIFRQDLYGYGVIDLDCKQSMRFTRLSYKKLHLNGRATCESKTR